jgi:hypothetical protein
MSTAKISEVRIYRMFLVYGHDVPGHNGKCGGCNWEHDELYVIAQNEDEAKELVLQGEAGLCGDCMCDLLTGTDCSEDYEIHTKPKPEKVTHP